MIGRSKYIVLTCIIALLSQGNLLAQKVKKKTTRIRVEYFKNAGNKEILIATLRIKDKRYMPFTDAEVQFYNLRDTSSILIGKRNTNGKGEAYFDIKSEVDIVKDSLGFMAFEVRFIGNDWIKSYKRKIAVKQLHMDVSFFQKDTIKYIEVSINESGDFDQPTPLENQHINFYIKGTFSLLKFGENKSDKNGKAIVEFPIDMPGDTVGILTIVAKIEEDKTYGTIESIGEINWGVPVPLENEKQRGLGDTDAPLWMVYTLIILLSAVWFHYFYVIYLIVKIKMSRTSIE